MKRFSFTLRHILLISSIFYSCHSKPDQASVTFFCTTDVHGSLFDYDLKKDAPTDCSLARISGYLQQARTQNKAFVLLDGGDCLQGQPSNYYFNFIATDCTNLVARIMNYLGYAAGAVGNHDIEAGHPVYDKIVQAFHFPWLAANAVDRKTGKPYFAPYTVLKRNGLKIAVLGMITPGIPKWLPAPLWEGIEFEDMIETARKWVPLIQKEEKPDLLVGLFHSGLNYDHAGENKDTPRNENATMLVAKQVDGFDLIFSGHDHLEKCEAITNDAGRRVWMIDPKSHARALAKVVVRLTRNGKGYDKEIEAELLHPAQFPTDSNYLKLFAPAFQQVKDYISTKIGTFTADLSGREGLFGPSAFTDFIHNAQLQATGADLSFSTVLQMDAHIQKGDITIRDLFNLYKYENGLYTMRFTGAEIDKYLEYAYGLQYNTMSSPRDHLLKFKTDGNGQPVRNSQGRCVLAAEYFNYSCAAGIRYTVDVSREPGQRVSILSLSDGRPFHADSTYTVAINSYRGNGGGGHLTQGIGWTKEEINRRILKIWDKDVRHYLSEYIKSRQSLTPQCRHDWKVVPEAYFNAGKARDYSIIYQEH